MEPSVSGGDNFVWVGLPDEGFRLVIIVLPDEAVDGGLQIDNGIEHAVFQSSPGQFGKEPLDGIQPGTGCRREVEGPSSVTF